MKIWVVQTRSGSFGKIEEKYLFDAASINNEKEYQEYLSHYSVICGEKSPNLHSIPFHQIIAEKEKKKRISEEKAIKLPELTNQLIKLEKECEKCKSELSNLKEKAEILKEKIPKIVVTSFQIVGDLTEKSKDGKEFALFGSAIPQSGNMLQKGLTNQGMIILKNAEQSDIATPEHFRPEKVLTIGYYSKSFFTTTKFGKRIEVNVFTKDIPKAVKIAKSLESDLSENLEKQKDIDNKIYEIWRLKKEIKRVEEL
ncbi:MAG: hypothetical protein KBG21_11150 [Ignavibacteria bacterium]|nr:hypothetical protein [Ignavibacteria bacterium]